jgi:kumamolisin
VGPVRGEQVERAPASRARRTLTLRLRSRAASPTLLEDTLGDVLAGRRAPLTRKAFAKWFGASHRDIAHVRRFAREHGFTVSSVCPAERIVHLTGPASDLAAAFGVNVARYRVGHVTWTGYKGFLHVPAALADCVTAVFGFDDRPQARRGPVPDAAAAIAPRPRTSYTPPEVAELYAFPQEADGRGQTVGVVALGGGYLKTDLRAFFRKLRLPHPRVTAVSVCGAHNAPRGATAAFDGEVTGDVETVGALVPRAHIVVYFAPNSARGFVEAVSRAVHDTRHNISVLSVSWGQAEVHWARQSLRVLNEVLLAAAVLGVTVCCASGDHGSFADAFDRQPHVCFPASSPYVLACGGTTLVGRRARIASESVWHNQAGASGGGVSVVFARPSWQRHSHVPKAANGFRGRGVPDVASNADPTTGYRIFGHGRWHVGAGTSASAPLWAGLVARINQMRGTPVGLLTPFLYAEYDALVSGAAIRPITRGNNGAYRARRGWNCCTGVGAPHGANLARARIESDRREPRTR